MCIYIYIYNILYVMEKILVQRLCGLCAGVVRFGLCAGLCARVVWVVRWGCVYSFSGLKAF